MTGTTPEALMGNLGRGGWEELHKLTERIGKPPAPEDGHAAYERACLYRDTFGTSAGRLVLAELVDQTINKVGFDASRGLLDGIAFGFARQGQNSLVTWILQQIKRAEAGPPRSE